MAPWPETRTVCSARHVITATQQAPFRYARGAGPTLTQCDRLRHRQRGLRTVAAAGRSVLATPPAPPLIGPERAEMLWGGERVYPAQGPVSKTRRTRSQPWILHTEEGPRVVLFSALDSAWRCPLLTTGTHLLGLPGGGRRTGYGYGLNAGDVVRSMMAGSVVLLAEGGFKLAWQGGRAASGSNGLAGSAR